MRPTGRRVGGLYLSQNKDMVATVKLENDDTATQRSKRFTNRMKKLTENNRCVVGSLP